MLRVRMLQLPKLSAQAALLAMLTPTATQRRRVSRAQRALMQLRWQLPVLPVLRVSMMPMRLVFAAP